MKISYRRTVLFALVVALGLAAMPLVGVSAAGQFDPPALPAGEKLLSSERLERIWARQLRIYERIGQGVEREAAFIERVQGLIDRAEASGKDISAVQAALDAFEAALKDAQPLYESAKGIISSHQGFDEDGKVTDPQKARETIEAMRAKLHEMKEAMGGTGRALRDAIRAFREANPRPQSTSSP